MHAHGGIVIAGDDRRSVQEAFATAALSTDDALTLLDNDSHAEPRTVAWALYVLAWRRKQPVTAIVCPVLTHRAMCLCASHAPARQAARISHAATAQADRQCLQALAPAVLAILRRAVSFAIYPAAFDFLTSWAFHASGDACEGTRNAGVKPTVRARAAGMED
jgi:hypothetical protein